MGGLQYSGGGRGRLRLGMKASCVGPAVCVIMYVRDRVKETLCLCHSICLSASLSLSL